MKQLPLVSPMFDPENPNRHGYMYCKPRSRFIDFLWWLYGPGIVAWYLHREQTAFGRFQNWAAKRILKFIYSP